MCGKAPWSRFGQVSCLGDAIEGMPGGRRFEPTEFHSKKTRICRHFVSTEVWNIVERLARRRLKSSVRGGDDDSNRQQGADKHSRSCFAAHLSDWPPTSQAGEEPR